MAARSTAAGKTPVTLEIVTPGGPSLAYHVGCIINNTLYVHGGIDKAGSTSPLNAFHKFDFAVGTWNSIRSPNSPTLSHHACVVVENRCIVLIGGWNGRARISDVFVYDVTKGVWRFPQTTGFPDGAGLSSHTATLLANGDVLVVGREGSLRMQRRRGSAFILTGNASNESSSFRYNEHVISVTSRTGHSLHLVDKNFVIIGGRDDRVVEMQPMTRGLAPEPNVLLPGLKLKSVASSLAPVPKGMNSRRHHVAVACGHGLIFVHGGWTFDGRRRDPVSDMFLLSLKKTMNATWFALGDSGFGLAGHVCCCCWSSGRIFMHGGESGRRTIQSAILELKVSDVV